mgnify:CR=1 FL=1
MDPKEILRAQFMEIVDNQLKSNNPPITRVTLKRLQDEGYIEADAKNLIAACVGATVFEVMKKNQPFDEQAYEAMLNRLPELPGREIDQINSN